MKKNNKTRMLIIISIIIVVSAFFTSCVPTPGGSGTTPSGTFNIGISATFDYFYDWWDFPFGISKDTSKIILIDGDSIRFNATSAEYTESGILTRSYASIQINVLNNQANNYQLLYIEDSLFRSSSQDGLKTINNNTYTQDKWKVISTVSKHYLFPLPMNFEKYIVFRKLKPNNQYLYFWLKVKGKMYKANRIHPYYGETSINIIETHCLNGKYQLNNITTGL
ncbi:MAG: hypothetical protein IPK18_11050 [Sphingobacteriales bacterium]|nr:MAG: hypothetical protein IPK18_11050 [Sphingobacteriales bacterium]